MRDFLWKWKLADPKFKMKPFYKTSSKKGSQLQIEAILQDFVHSSKTKNFCATCPSFKTDNTKNEALLSASFKLSAKLIASCQWVSQFFHPSVQSTVPHLPRKKVWCYTCNPPRKSAPWHSQNVWWRRLLYCACQTKSIFVDTLQTLHACHLFWNMLHIQNPRALVAFGWEQNPLLLPQDMAVQRPEMVQSEHGVLLILLTSERTLRHSRARFFQMLRTWIFFLRFSSLTLPTTAYHCCCICPYVRSLTSKSNFRRLCLR